MELQGKTAIITGISKGIGKATVLELLDKGAKVAGLGMTAPDYSHENLKFYKTDVRKFDEMEAAFKQVAADFGPEIHILVNNSGLGYFGYLEDISLDQWHEMFDVNINGMFYGCKLAIPQMKKQQYGHIFNISSTAGLEGMPQVSAYNATKFAVKGLSQGLYKEVRDDRIKVTCIYPGSTKTDFFRNSPGIDPHDYMLKAEDISGAIMYALQSPDNTHHVNIEIRPLQPKGPKR